MYDFERTAIVPPLQSMPSANQVELKGRRLTDEFPGKVILVCLRKGAVFFLLDLCSVQLSACQSIQFAL